MRPSYDTGERLAVRDGGEVEGREQHEVILNLESVIFREHLCFFKKST